MAIMRFQTLCLFESTYLPNQTVPLKGAFLWALGLTVVLAVINYVGFQHSFWSCLALAAIDIQPPFVLGAVFGLMMWLFARATGRQPSRHIIWSAVLVMTLLTIVAILSRHQFFAASHQ